MWTFWTLTGIARKLCVFGMIMVAGIVIGCANVPSPQEQGVLPPPPIYASTLAPTRTAVPTQRPSRVPPTATTLPSPPQDNLPTASPTARNTPSRDPNALNEYQRGIAYIAVDRNEYSSDESRRSLDNLFATGANYVSLLVTWYQPNFRSTEIARAENTPTDADLAYVIDYAHAHGLKVLLKPQVDFTADEEHWRGQISFENEADWATWFASYRDFILHYARLAQAHGVEEFSVGTELFATSARTADWRAIIRAVRDEYTGLLTYSANHSGEEVQVRFWNDLDFIGVNVFYHLTNYRTPTMEQILEGWRLPVRQLTNVHKAFPDKPMIFTEVGYPSMDLASVWPWNWDRYGATDTEEQAMLYDALFSVWWYNPDRPWFRGLFIWNWQSDPDIGGEDDPNYTPYRKPAEEILKHYYGIKKPQQETTK